MNVVYGVPITTKEGRADINVVSFAVNPSSCKLEILVQVGGICKQAISLDVEDAISMGIINFKPIEKLIPK